MISIASRYESYTAQELIDLHRKCAYQAGVRAGSPYTDRDKELSETMEQVEQELLKRAMKGAEQE